MWKWQVVEVYPAAKLQGKYPPLSSVTLWWIIVIATQVEKLADKNITFGKQSDVQIKAVCFSLAAWRWSY